jgi:CRISPR system Cascade subunit CasA
MALKKKENQHSPDRFNLIDEPWIPIVDTGLVSLRQLCINVRLRFLGGNPVQKIALLKLLEAISQAASTPADNAGWESLGPKGLAKNILTYLDKHYEDFYLYGKKPFLQIPAIAAAAKQPFGAVMPHIATGNTTVLTQSQQEQSLSDAEKALLVVQLTGFALGGKKTDNSVVLTSGYQGKRNDKGKPSTGKPGASLGFLGYLHNFLTGSSLLETLWLNLLPKQQRADMKIFQKALGPFPWETPPTGEHDSIAGALKKSLMGRLVPFSRFVLLADNGIHYSEGILHPNHQDGISDPSVAIAVSEKNPKVLWTDPSKRPWRSLASLLGFLSGGQSYFDCPYIHLGLDRINSSRMLKKLSVVGIWSAGLRVSSNAGEQYVSGSDDYVESEILLESAVLGETMYINLKNEMNMLDEMSRVLYGRVAGYYRELKADGEPFSKQASELYWQLCEKRLQDLIDACYDADSNETKKLHPYFSQCVKRAYESFCPRETARQLNAWAENYPNLSKYTAVEKKAAKTVNT